MPLESAEHAQSSIPSNGSSGNISSYSAYDSKLSINDFDLLKVRHYLTMKQSQPSLNFHDNDINFVMIHAGSWKR